MLIYFNMFWPNFMTTDPVNYTFFIDFFSRVFNTKCTYCFNIQEADILIESMFGSFPLIGIKKWKYAFYYSGENFMPTDERYTAILGCSTKNANYSKVPQIISFMYCTKLLEEFKIPKHQTVVPKKLLCSLISNSNGSVRNAFIQRLEDRGIHIDHGGRYKHNIDKEITGTYNSPDVKSFLSNYKFVIAMENSYDEYYITEKICHGLQNGIIPIYWGPQTVNEYINSERFLHLKSDAIEDMDVLIDRILSMSDETYLHIVNQPILACSNIFETSVDTVKSCLNQLGAT